MTSLWADTIPGDEVVTGCTATRHSIDDLAQGRRDVVIVGAGYTGLWTAYELLQRDPSRGVTILERRHIGFGASGRNGGWGSAILPMSLDRVAAEHGPIAATRLQAAMHDTVRSLADFAADFAAKQLTSSDAADIVHLGGTIDVARNASQVARLRAHVDEMRRYGFGPEDYRYVDQAEASDWCNATGALGGAVTPHCAVIHPLRMVHLLARAVIAAGGKILEGVTVTAFDTSDRGTRLRGRFDDASSDASPSDSTFMIEADIVVQATEAYSCELPGQRRNQLPIYSMMVATEPLDDAVWDTIGLTERPTFADGRNLIVYGQRSADNRLVFGGRGAPYHFGSRIDPRFDVDSRIAQRLQRSLTELFPATASAAITHHWGGVLAAPRDWTCSVRFDPRRGFGQAGGYVGDGVTTAALSGATLAELIIPGERPDLSTLPIVDHRSRRWEVEPFRWLGVNAARFAAARADDAEMRHPDRASTGVWSRAMHSLLRR